MSTKTTLLVTLLMIGLASLTLAQQQTQPKPAANPEEGFVSIFDGKTLKDWDGDPKYWRAEDGNLVGEIKPGDEIRQNTFIIWRGGRTKDFEFKCDYRISDQGNSGINYRSSDVEGQKYVMKGYQFDIDGPRKNTGDTRHTGNLYEERGRTFMALRGQFTHAAEGGVREVIASLGDYKEMTKIIKNEDWNQVHIIARANRIIHILNGQITSMMSDDDAANRTMDGLLGVQVHVGPPMKVEYRNIRIRTLPTP